MGKLLKLSFFVGKMGVIIVPGHAVALGSNDEMLRADGCTLSVMDGTGHLARVVAVQNFENRFQRDARRLSIPRVSLEML